MAKKKLTVTLRKGYALRVTHKEQRLEKKMNFNTSDARVSGKF